MDVSSINWLHILAAAVAAWLFGAAWYMGLSKPWLKAARIDLSTSSRSMVPFVVSFVAEILMALVFSLLLGTITFGEPSVTAGLFYGFILWLGFIATTFSVNHRYQGFGWGLTIIDIGHWLGVMLLIGAILGWLGAPPPAA